MRRVSALLLGSLALFGLPMVWAARAEGEEPVAARELKPTVRLECLKAAETREAVRARHFLEPFAAVKIAARETKAEALSAKLCRMGGDWIYSITLLRHDGHTAHIWLDAATGRVVPPRARETIKN